MARFKREEKCNFAVKGRNFFKKIFHPLAYNLVCLKHHTIFSKISLNFKPHLCINLMLNVIGWSKYNIPNS